MCSTQTSIREEGSAPGPVVKGTEDGKQTVEAGLGDNRQINSEDKATFNLATIEHIILQCRLTTNQTRTRCTAFTHKHTAPEHIVQLRRLLGFACGKTNYIAINRLSLH